MSSPVVFAMTTAQAGALLDVYHGRDGPITSELAWRQREALIARGLVEEAGGDLFLTSAGYHAARLAAVLDRASHQKAARVRRQHAPRRRARRRASILAEARP